ncbi:MAG: hypothetical protein HC880_05680 [Bacteroidia bacterium]|nr:hypothetical protein [Bacteroidia bacterium]
MKLKLPSVLIGLMGCTGGFYACQISNSQTPDGPNPPVFNVVFIISDDHPPGVVGAYGNPIIRTPGENEKPIRYFLPEENSEGKR